MSPLSLSWDQHQSGLDRSELGTSSISCLHASLSDTTMTRLCVMLSSAKQLCATPNTIQTGPLGLGACIASLSSPSRLLLSNLIGAGTRHTMDIADNSVPNVPGLTCMTWVFDVTKQDACNSAIPDCTKRPGLTAGHNVQQQTCIQEASANRLHVVARLQLFCRDWHSP